MNNENIFVIYQESLSEKLKFGTLFLHGLHLINKFSIITDVLFHTGLQYPGVRYSAESLAQNEI